MITTKKHFEDFKSYVKEYQEKLGLKDWHIYVFHKKTSNSAYAETFTGVADSAASIHLNISWTDRELTEKELRECALHEVLHVVTAPLYSEAKARYADEYTLEAAEHSVVVRMTNVLKDLI